MKILFIFLLLMPTICYAQISKPGVQAENGGTVLGRALTINCDGNCIQCNLSGTTMNITFSSSCSGGGTNFLLLEDATFFLLEDNGKTILE